MSLLSKFFIDRDLKKDMSSIVSLRGRTSPSIETTRSKRRKCTAYYVHNTEHDER